MAPEDINDRVAVMGRQLWRVVPYATAYPRRLATGMLANACARARTFCPSSPSVGRSITSPRGLSQDSALWLTLSRRSISPLLVTASSFSSPS